MRFIRTALKAWGGRKRGWVEGWRGRGGVHSSAVSLWPSQQQLKQVCVFNRGTEGKTSLTWFKLVTLDHTLTLHLLEKTKAS